MKLQWKIFLLFLVIACVPALLLGGTVVYLIDLAHRRDVSNLELQALDRQEKEMQKFFAETLGVLELQVESLDVAPQPLDGARGKQPWQETLAKEILRANPAFQEVTFIGLDGKETAKASSYDAQPPLLYVAELPEFQAAKEGKPFLGEVYHTLAGPMVTMAAPVKAEGRTIQVLSAQVSLSSLARSLQAVQLGSTGYGALFDENGTLIAGPVPEYEAGPESNRPGFRVSEWERWKEAARGQVLSGLAERDRYESLFGTGPVVGAARVLKPANWIGIVEWPVQEADAVTRDVRHQVVLLTLASILAVLLFAPLFASRLVKPIRELEAGAKAIEQGDFEKKVNIRTQDELEELGEAFNKMAKGLKRLEELREEFVFVAAHELRTPVTIIKGYTSMILEGDAGAVKQTVKDFLGKIQSANERLLQLVEDLLQVARAEAGRLEVRSQNIDIREPIRATVAELQQLAKEKSIQLSYEEAEVPNALADEARLREIMMNLAGNALKYTPKKGRVKIFHELKGNEIVTHVQDNGLGIPKEAQAKIFQKFYRVQNKETEAIPGTGLGLFIVKQLVEKMQGKIWFVSEHGKGTAFSFSLPMISHS